MLSELTVHQFATIDHITIRFQSGLNILSGETGAGKSLLLKSLALLMGAKSSSEVVRSGADQAVVEGSFDLSHRPDILKLLRDQGIEAPENQLIVRRIVHREGKSRVYINGCLSPLNALQELVSPLIEVAGAPAPLIEMTTQHENRSLMSRTYHLNLLDRFAGALPLRQTYLEHFDELIQVRKQLNELRESERSRAQRLDFLSYQRDEIRALGLKPGEEDILEMDFQRLRNSHHLVEWAQSAESALYGDDDSALVRVHRVLQRGNELSQMDPSLHAKLEPLRQAKMALDDFVYDIRAYAADAEASPERLEELEKRRSDFRTIQKKYGSTVNDILKVLSGIEQEIKLLENADENVSEMEAQISRIEKSLAKIGGELHQLRTKAAEKLTKKVNDELADLNMKGVKFHIAIEKLSQPQPTGFTEVEFQIQNSPKDEPRGLSRTASGGELSRILLALKEVVGSHEQPRTYLFDEVDSGVSGPTAEKVGKKLHIISKGQQVICVTHLPQVASQGDVHFVIRKTSTAKGVRTEVLPLETRDRVQEIARLISGEKITKTSIAHAEQLLGH